MANIDDLIDELGALRITMELIALGCSSNPAIDAANVLVEQGFWSQEKLSKLRRIGTLPDPAEGDGWMPIGMAPKDGSMFLCWVKAERWSHPDGGGSGIGQDVSQIDFCWWRVVPQSPDGGYFDAACGQIGDMQYVTHWRPLPAPPTAISGEDNP